MIIGVCRLKIMIFESNSLKDKRQVIKSIIGKIQSRFNVSIAEVELNESWKTSVIGISFVSNSRKYADEIISKIIKFIDNDGRLEIVDQKIEFL